MVAASPRGRLVVNGRTLTEPQPTGTSRVASLLMRAIVAQGIAVDVVVPRGPVAVSGSRTIGPPMQGRFSGHVWEQLVLPAATRGRTIFSPGNLAPIASSRSAMVIQDLSIIRHPEWSSPGGRVFGRLMALSARRAQLVVVPSAEVAAHVAALGVDQAATEVVHWTADPAVSRVNATAVSKVRDRLDIKEPYALCVGWQSPRKNARLLIDAHRLALSRAQHLLVLVGPANPGFASMDIGTHNSIRVFEYLDEASLAALLTGAAALAYPSLDEGFGLPPHEAAAVGIPVLIADIPVLRETAPEGVCFLPINNANAWADAIVEACDGRLAPPRPNSRTWTDVAEDVIGALRRRGLLEA